ncbi:MAG: hypothetical protein K1X87_04785 [Dehalococcoidia bacterium]|nr:hypothetical protein [Dehalococcoidia bacterium]
MASIAVRRLAAPAKGGAAYPHSVPVPLPPCFPAPYTRRTGNDGDSTVGRPPSRRGLRSESGTVQAGRSHPDLNITPEPPPEREAPRRQVAAR